jgi:DNA modification methylase
MTGPRTFLGGRVILHVGDCRDVLRGMADNSVDSVVTDPPYHLTSIVKRNSSPNAAPSKFKGKDDGGPYSRTVKGFMGKQWDGGDIAFRPELWAEVLRVLKPGGYIMAFSGCRTYHRMACAIEDAGFITHPMFCWAFGSGFPKAHSVSKQIDREGPQDQAAPFAEFARHYEDRRKANRLTHAKICKAGGWFGGVNHGGSSVNWANGYGMPTPEQWEILQPLLQLDEKKWKVRVDRIQYEREKIGEYETDMGGLGGERLGKSNGDITIPASAAAREWDGWFYGTQSLKPAIEPIYFGQKPFSEKTGAANVLKHSVGAVNIEACRVPTEPRTTHARGNVSGEPGQIYGNGNGLPHCESDGALSRWPANLIHDGSDEVLACFPETGKSTVGDKAGGCEFFMDGDKRESAVSGFGDSGSAARFFASFPQEEESCRSLHLEHYTTGERESCPAPNRIFYTSKAGADDRLGSSHPTVKPLDLIQYLVRLITPKNGVCLDLFAGTGTTAEACFRDGFRAILIEREAEYIKDIERRMSLVMEGHVTRAHAGMKARGRPVDNGPLFGGIDLLDVKIELAKIAVAAGCDIEVKLTKPIEEAAK